MLLHNYAILCLKTSADTPPVEVLHVEKAEPSQ